MMYLFSLLAGVALAGNTEKQCLRDALGEMGQVTLDTCDMNSKLLDCEREVQSLRGTCGKGGGGGGGGGEVNYAATVVSGSDKMTFATSLVHPKEKAFTQLHTRTIDFFKLDDGYDLKFKWSNTNPWAHGLVVDDQTLDEAWSASKYLGFKLVLFAEKNTVSPTGEPTNEPTPMPTYPPSAWHVRRVVHQKAGVDVADARNNGIPTTRSFSFKKLEQNSLLRIIYKETIRVKGNGHWCIWEIEIDNKRCPTVPMRGGMHGSQANNEDHQPVTIGGLCGNIAKGDHTIRINMGGNNLDCHTGWDPDGKGMFMFEIREVRNNENNYHGFTADNDDGNDNNVNMAARKFSFNKKLDATKSRLRLIYIDNFRAYNGAQCTWNIRMDGGHNCKWNGASIIIRQSLNSHGGENDHVPGAFGGWCEGLAAGQHTMSISVDSNGDCYSGWNTNHHLEAEEYANDYPQMTVFQRFGNNIDARDGNGYIDWRTMTFNKKEADTYLKLTYIDNLRVHGHGRWCKWNLYIQGKECPSGNISGAKYAANNNNNHFPHIIMGYCKGVPKGDNLSFKVYLTGGTGHDCYTGWERNPPHTMTFTMEVEEVAASRITMK